MLDSILIKYCSPTLGNLKTASLFTYPTVSQTELEKIVAEWNSELNPKGVTIYSLGSRGKRTLIYVCRISRLQQDLEGKGVGAFLFQYGYESLDIENCIERLRERIQESVNFPHEIGLFLGYPLEDVEAFIANEGKNHKCSGCWKVYHDESEAEKLFAKYKKCKDVYTRLFDNRIKSVFELTVAA